MNPSLKSLRAYLDKGGDTPRWTPTPGVVVVGSGKGGVGTSTVSTLLALAGAREGRQVLLVDGDEGVGSLHFLLGVDDPGPGLEDLRGGELEPSDLLRPVSENLWFLPGGGGPEATLTSSLGERRALMARVTTLYPAFHFVVVDGGSHLASVLAACGTGPERLLALTTPDRIAMAGNHALQKVTRSRFPHLPVEVLVNRGNNPTSEDVFRMMSLAGSRFLGLKPGFAGSIPEDPHLQAHCEDGANLPSLSASSPAAEAAAILHARLAGQQMAAQADFPTPASLPFPA